jgi:hypothetical protein
VQVIEMRVSDKHKVDRGKIAYTNSRFAKALQHKQPAGEIRVNYDILAAHLYKEAGVPNESQSQFTVAHQSWFVNFPSSGRDYGVANEASELTGAAAQSSILDCGLKHRLGESYVLSVRLRHESEVEQHVQLPRTTYILDDIFIFFDALCLTSVITLIFNRLQG